jgi:ABC-type transport system involved in resistance to organic solvents, periplasmic component
MKTMLLVVGATMFFASFLCLCAIINRFFVSLKPIRAWLVTCGVLFALSLVAFGFTVEEKPGTVVGTRSYRTVYYINGVRVGSSGVWSRSKVVGRVTVIGTVALICLLSVVMGLINAFSLVYAKEKAKAGGRGIVGRIARFHFYSCLGYFSLGILPMIYLSDAKRATSLST